MPKYFHYTRIEHLESIKRDGFIKRTESNVSEEKEHAGPDVVWLFNKPLVKTPSMLIQKYIAEGTTAGGENSRAEQDRQGNWYLSSEVKWRAVNKAQVQIEIELERTEVIRADKFLKKQGADSEWMLSLERTGQSKFTEQYVILEQIPVEKITNIIIREDLNSGISGLRR